MKVNCVLMRGFNEDQIIAFGKFARDEGVIVRFIEFMPLEEDRVWSPDVVVTLPEILRRMAEYRPLVEIPHGRSETARRYRFDDGIGEFPIPFARIAGAFESPAMAKSGHASSPSGITISTDFCVLGLRMISWLNSLRVSCSEKKTGTTLESRTSCAHPVRWCTSADETL